MYIANYGDFVFGEKSDPSWASQAAKYQTYWQYWSGTIFNKLATDEPDSPLLWPLKINLVRIMCLSQAGALFGQWEDTPISFRCHPLEQDESDADMAEKAREIIEEVSEASSLPQKMIEVGINMQVYGGSYLRAAIDPMMPYGIRIDKLMPYQVFPRWHPLDIDRILEAYITIPVDKRDAMLAYGISESQLPHDAVYMEHWTETDYRVTVGDVMLTEGLNPWGFVPIVYIPRVRSEDFYGVSLAEDVMGLQDELNNRMADMGDRINDNAHPIRCVRNYRGDPAKDFQVGSDALWNLGTSMPGMDPPDAFVLRSEPEPVSTFQYLKFMLDLTRNSSFTSAVAFGEDEGSQRSGATLEMRLWPILQTAKMSRAYMKQLITRLNTFILKMIAHRGDIDLSRYRVVPDFAPLVPRDMRLWIEEFIARAQNNMISPEEAIAGFGVRRGSEGEEIERIKAWLDYQTRIGYNGSRPARGEYSGDMPA